MRLSQLRPCSGCGGPVFTPATGRTFFVVRLSGAAVSVRAVEVLEAAARTLAPLAEIESRQPKPDEAVVVLGDQDPKLMQEALLCSRCYFTVASVIGALRSARAEDEGRPS
jgi:hypothetical protein